MDRSGHKLFSRPAFTGDQHAAIGRCDDCDLLSKRPHRDGLTNHHILLGELALELRIDPLELALSNRIFTVTKVRSRLRGFSMKLKAPSFVDFTAVSMF